MEGPLGPERTAETRGGLGEYRDAPAMSTSLLLCPSLPDGPSWLPSAVLAKGPFPRPRLPPGCGPGAPLAARGTGRGRGTAGAEPAPSPQSALLPSPEPPGDL